MSFTDPRRGARGAGALALLFALAGALPAQAPADQAALLLAGARRAYNEKNHSFAAARFREFIARYPSHKDTPSARYGLALCLIEGPQRNPDQAAEQLQQVAHLQAFPDRPFAVYYLGLTRRAQGLAALDLAAAHPAQAAAHRNTARQRFDEASKQYAEADKAFTGRAKDAKPPATGIATDLEWAARARCDRAEMLLRLRKPREARQAVAAVATGKQFQPSRYRSLALYYSGFASFQLGEPLAAGRALGQLRPFTDPLFGTHARYLLARVHHLETKQNEREEAKLHYQGVLATHEAQKKAAQAALRQPARFNSDPDEKARLERLVKGPAPDHVARSLFFAAVLEYEDGQFAQAAERFKAFVGQFPSASLVMEARLRHGFCQVQLKQFKEAVATLGPVVKEPLLADQALLWTAKAQVGLADPAKPATFAPALDSFRKAAEQARQRAAANPPDPGARGRRGEALLEYAEALQLAHQPKDAPAALNTILAEKLLPGRDDEVHHALTTAYQVAGDYVASDKVCQAFLKDRPKSTLRPAVLFRHAENAAFLALAADKRPNPAERAREKAKHNDEAIQRYEALIDKYPEHAHANLARHGLGLACYRKGDLEKAQKALESISAAERTGELAVVGYQLADVHLRQTPARAEDAIAAGKIEERLKAASELLEAFVAAGETPQTPDALLKLGYCQQRTAALLAQPADRQKALGAARSAYERIQQKYPNHPTRALATFERAKVLALSGDVNSAQGELKRFAQDPLKKAAVAPMARLHLATLLRRQNRPADAAKELEECRKDHEAELTRDPARSARVVLLQYHHAVALREAGKLPEARTLFDQVARTAPNQPEGWEAALRGGQAHKESGEKKMAEARKLLANPGLQPPQRAAAQKTFDDGLKDLRDAVASLGAHADALKARKPATEELGKTLATTRSRILYETAWGWRAVAREEFEAARRAVQLQRWQKRRDELAKTLAPGQTMPPVALPEVDRKDVPVQPGETQARLRYKMLIEAFPDVALNADARFELAELLAQRDEHDAAVKLLQEALEKEPAPELTDRIKVRLGTCLLDRGVRKLLASRKKLSTPALKPAEKAAAQKQAAAGTRDVEAAQEQLQPVAENPRSSVLAHALYREAECLLHLGKSAEAIKRLVKFRDGPFQGIPGLSDRALLRLGHAYGEAKQWDASRQAYEALVARFGNSPWVHEARYGVGWAWQNQGQYDHAVNAYTQVHAAVTTALGARAQLNVGLCRLAQKRYADASTALLVVPFTYDYPDLSALALLEAARAFSESKQPSQAVKLLRRVQRDHPGTAHADAAKKRLADLGKS